MTRSGPARHRHLVDVWNPSYASDAMTAHLTVLLEAAQRTKGTEEAPYVWWGKVRSPNRQQELRNLPQVLEIARDLERDEDGECHLYLTDYRSLYVGLVDAITSEDVRRTDGVHVPPYYTANSLDGGPPAGGLSTGRRPALRS